MDEFCVALNGADFAHLGHATARVMLLMAEIVLLRFAARLLKRMVSFFFFCLERWLTASHIAGQFGDREPHARVITATANAGR
jgi:hypothetical protein